MPTRAVASVRSAPCGTKPATNALHPRRQARGQSRDYRGAVRPLGCPVRVSRVGQGSASASRGSRRAGAASTPGIFSEGKSAPGGLLEQGESRGPLPGAEQLEFGARVTTDCVVYRPDASPCGRDHAPAGWRVQRFRSQRAEGICDGGHNLVGGLLGRFALALSAALHRRNDHCSTTVKHERRTCGPAFVGSEGRCYSSRLLPTRRTPPSSESERDSERDSYCGAGSGAE